MVTALAVFLPLLGAFLSVWLTHRRPTASLFVSLLFLAGGLASTLILSLELGAWDMKELGASTILRTGVGLPPLSIDLEVTAAGALAAIGIYAAAILGISRLFRRNPATQPLLLALVTASLGLLFSTDLFNSFVFIEIGSIVTIGLTAACRCRRRWEVAVKVALISGLVTILYLLAVALVYRTTGELRLESLRLLGGVPALMVSALMLTVIMTEIKAFPLSGWGLDFYHGAGPSFAAVYSGTWSVAVLLWSSRVLPMLPLPDMRMLAWIGAGGLVLGQLAGMRSSSPGRMMGYSSAAYASIILILAGVAEGESYLRMVLVLVSFSALSKFSVFMMAGRDENSRWRHASGILLLLPLLTLLGIPPLPVFWAKLQLLYTVGGHSPLLLAAVAAGLMFESVYLLRFWSMSTSAGERDGRMVSTISTLLIIAGGAWLTAGSLDLMDLSGKLLASPVIRVLFAAIFAGGTALNLPGVINRLREERSYWTWMLLSGAALMPLPFAGNSITFYVLWEISAFAAVVAVSRGRKARAGTYWFSVFAAFSGLLLLVSAVLSGSGFPSRGVPLLLVVMAALVKLGQMGAHLWNVRAYGAAPATMPAFLAGTSSKAAVLLLVMALLGTGSIPTSGGRVLAWAGVLTALGMAVMAALSSNYKRVLAYASVSQMGYILAGLGLASVLGWTAAFYHTFNHFLFKSVLFLGAAGVIWRTGTADYNRLGGLVRRMPLTFAFTLISVIAFAGVPPLSGFGGKWLLYNGLIEAGWLPAALVAMFASVVAFLYAFRLLHAVFLGQLSGRHSSIGEAPPALLVPQAVLTGAVMVLSFRPTLLLRHIVPAAASIPGLTGSAPEIRGTSVISALGSWDAWSVGLMVVGVFGFAFVFYWISGRRPRHVGQLDMGFAGEIPPSPEEVHYTGDFFRPFRRALAFLPRLHAGGIFRGATGIIGMLGDGVRSVFTGDPRTYLAHSLIFMLLFFFLARGGV
ncbi:MAG: proton-conducting transporter membrane subunit [Candidatus Aegiribacteria sp.]